MKKQTPQSKSKRKHQLRRRVKSEQPPPPNSAHYHFENGEHVFTLKLCEGAFMATKTVGHLFGGSEGRARTTAEHALQMLLDSVAADLTQLEEDDMKEILTRVETGETAPANTQTIMIPLPIKAHAILAGQAAAGGYESPAHMILAHESAFCAQAGQDRDEKEYARMFGLAVEANGDTRFP